MDRCLSLRLASPHPPISFPARENIPPKEVKIIFPSNSDCRNGGGGRKDIVAVLKKRDTATLLDTPEILSLFFSQGWRCLRRKRERERRLNATADPFLCQVGLTFLVPV